MNFINRRQQPLTNDQLREVAPSIFAQEPWHAMSDRYSFIPTIAVVEEMRKNGFMPFNARQSRTRIEGKSDFTKHMIRFRDMNRNITSVGDTFAELVMTNSHDGMSAYDLSAGMFKLACLNGMIVADSEIDSIHVRHSGDVLPVIKASFELAESLPKLADTVTDWQKIVLAEPERKLLAEHALSLRYDTNENGVLQSPIKSDALLTPRRYQDNKPDLWATFNTVQENLTKGGLRGRTSNNRRTSTRAITGIAEDSKLNKALWSLAAKMAELKKQQ